MSGSNSSSRDAVAEPLSLAVHSMPVAVDDDAARRTRAGRWKMLGLFAICAAPVVASYFTYFVIRPEGRANYATLVSPSREMPPLLPLRALDGTPVAAASLTGQWLLVTVGSGACDAACEERLYFQRQLREMTGRDRDRIDKLWLVTDDTTPAAPLRAALDAAPPTRMLRVPREALARWLQPAPGHALEDHLYIVDPMGGWMMRAPADPDPVALERDLDRLLRASASWDRAGR